MNLQEWISKHERQSEKLEVTVNVQIIIILKKTSLYKMGQLWHLMVALIYTTPEYPASSRVFRCVLFPAVLPVI